MPKNIQTEKSLKPLPKNRGRLFLLYSLGLLLAVSNALVIYLQSSFLGQFINLRATSIFFIVSNLAVAVVLWFFPRVIRKLSNYVTTKAVLLLYAASLVAMAVASSMVTAILSLALFSIASNLIWINLDVLVESFSNDAATGRIRTMYFTFMNTGYVLAPILSAYLLRLDGYFLIFAAAASLVLPIFLIFSRQERNFKDAVKNRRESLIKILSAVWHNSNLRGIFFVALLLQIFYSTAVIYIPIYLHQNLGMDWGTLGIIFAIMLLPFIIFEIPAGIIADKYLGEKEILITGFIILTVSLFLFSYIDQPLAWLWAAVLFLSRIGAALVEAMRETYFFKLISAKDVGCINLFRLTSPLGYIIGSALAIAALSLWTLNYFFLVIALVMLSGVVFAASLKDTK
jgi:MFS family permease